MLAENIKGWFEEYEDKGRQEGLQQGEVLGRQQGRQQGEALVLQRLLSKRFGPVPSDITNRIADASVEQIEAWVDRVMDAQLLSDVFVDS